MRLFLLRFQMEVFISSLSVFLMTAFLDLYLEVEVLGHVVTLCLTF